MPDLTKRGWRVAFIVLALAVALPGVLLWSLPNDSNWCDRVPLPPECPDGEPQTSVNASDKLQALIVQNRRLESELKAATLDVVELFASHRVVVGKVTLASLPAPGLPDELQARIAFQERGLALLRGLEAMRDSLKELKPLKGYEQFMPVVAYGGPRSMVHKTPRPAESQPTLTLAELAEAQAGADRAKKAAEAYEGEWRKLEPTLRQLGFDEVLIAFAKPQEIADPRISEAAYKDYASQLLALMACARKGLAKRLAEMSRLEVKPREDIRPNDTPLKDPPAPRTPPRI